jgi:hypothetical protein
MVMGNPVLSASNVGHEIAPPRIDKASSWMTSHEETTEIDCARFMH